MEIMDISINDVAQAAEISYRAAWSKLTGRTDFSLHEAKRINLLLFPESDFWELFERSGEWPRTKKRGRKSTPGL